MASVKKGNLKPPPCWWKHMKWFKRKFWHKERQAWRKQIKNETEQ